MDPQLFRTKSIDQLISDADQPERRLKKTLGWLSLTALGVGAIIGSGIFVLTGTAAAGETVQFPSILKAPLLDVLMHGTHALGVSGRPGAGPAIAVSFFVVAVVCGLAGLCYAELASMIPIAGSAYTYTYATLGELVAWIIGWDLILEYAVSNMAVAVGFSAYINSLLDSFGIHMPAVLSTPAYSPDTGWAPHFNIMGFLIVMFLTVLLVFGIRESAGANNVMVGIKMLAIVVFCVAASKYIQPSNWHPFFPNHMQGVLTGGAIVFFTYIGFDSVSTAAEECQNPKRDLPIGILVSLFVCSFLYIAVALVLTGIQHWSKLNTAAPVARSARSDRAQRRESLGHRRRADGHDLLDSRFSAWAGARLVCDVPRRLASGRVFPRAQQIPHAGCGHLGRRLFRRDSGGHIRYRHPRRPFQYRHAVRFHSRFDCGADPAQAPAGAPARLSRSLDAVDPDRLGGVLLHSDGEPDRRKLAAILRVAADRPVRLSLLWPQAQRTRPRLAPQPR